MVSPVFFFFFFFLAALFSTAVKTRREMGIVEKKGGLPFLTLAIRYCFCRSLFVCLSEQIYAKSYEQISMKFSGSAGGGTRKNRLDFGSYR